MAWCSALVTVLCLLFLHAHAINEFKKYCRNLPNLGIGEYQKDHCTATFRFATGTPAEAMEMCAGAMPFNVKEATHGEETQCVYDKQVYECEAGETMIGKKCFIIKGGGLYSDYSKACGERYRFHVIENEFDRQWIALRMPDNEDDVWAGISGEYFDANRPIAHKGERTKRDTGAAAAARRGKIVKVHMTDKKVGNLIKGKLRGAVATEQHPFLCSRRGKAVAIEAPAPPPPETAPPTPPQTAPPPPPETAPPTPPQTAPPPPPETAPPTPPKTAPPPPPKTAPPPPKTAPPPPPTTKHITKQTTKKPKPHKPAPTKKPHGKPTKKNALPPGQSLGPIDSPPTKKP